MNIYRAKIIGNTSGLYINPCNSEILVSESVKDMINYKDVNFDGVNSLVIHYENEQGKIVQASGYTPDRGLFVDMY